MRTTHPAPLVHRRLHPAEPGEAVTLGYRGDTAAFQSARCRIPSRRPRGLAGDVGAEPADELAAVVDDWDCALDTARQLKLERTVDSRPATPQRPEHVSSPSLATLGGNHRPSAPSVVTPNSPAASTAARSGASGSVTCGQHCASGPGCRTPGSMTGGTRTAPCCCQVACRSPRPPSTSGTARPCSECLHAGRVRHASVVTCHSRVTVTGSGRLRRCDLRLCARRRAAA